MRLLGEMVAADLLERAADLLTVLGGIPIGILEEGSVVVRATNDDVCLSFHLACPESAASCREHAAAVAEPLFDGTSPCGIAERVCPFGLRTLRTPVVLGGKAIAFLIGGRFLFDDDVFDEETLRSNARRFGFPEGAYLDAYRRAPRFRREKAERTMTAAAALFGMLAEAGCRERLAREGAERFRLLFEGTRNGVAVYEAVDDGNDFVFLDVNSAVERMEHVERRSILGTRVTEAFPGVREFGLLDVFRRVWRTGEAVRHPISLYLDDRVVGWRENDVFRLPSGEIVAVYDDISDRKCAEFEKEKLIRELESKNAELERFAYTVSHDLKSPLITVKGFLGHLRRDLAAGRGEKTEADMSYIAQAADQMSALLDDLLALSRIGQAAHPPARVSLAEVVNEAIGRVAGRAVERGIGIAVERLLPDVWGDRQRLVEVFQNLLDNAIKFLGDQPAPCIEVGVRHDNEQVVAFVRDNGIGVDPRYRERIFGLFDKLDPCAPGTGVGLALVRRIVEIHGGKVWVESEGRGEGSTFFVLLPKPPEEGRQGK